MIGNAPVRTGATVEVRFDTDAGRLTAEVEVPAQVETSASADVAVVAGWLPAMARREPLEVEGPVSPRLLAGVEQIADVLLRWDRAIHRNDPWYGRVPLVAEPAPSVEPLGSRRSACFFTGGVDSFHSVLELADRLDELVFVHGFDLPPDPDEPLNREVSARLQEAASQLGLPLIELRCNLVGFAAASGIGWDDYHGAAMATVAHLLAPRWSTVYVPATTTYDRLYPLGSHPLIDPLWSSEQVEIVHHGADATRVEKLRAIADHPAALRHLRVCAQNLDDAYNCGSCEKCVRTAVGIRIAGAEGRFEGLPSPSLRQVGTVEVRSSGHTWSEYADELAATGTNPRLLAAIRVALARNRLRDAPVVRRWVR